MLFSVVRLCCTTKCRRVLLLQYLCDVRTLAHPDVRPTVLKRCCDNDFLGGVERDSLPASALSKVHMQKESTAQFTAEQALNFSRKPHVVKLVTVGFRSELVL